VILSFSGSGTWAYLDNGQWQFVHSVTAAVAAVGDVNGDGKGEAVLNLGAGNGTWEYLAATGAGSTCIPKRQPC